MATAETRVSSWLFGGLFTTTVLVVLVFAVSTLTSALSAGLLMQLALGGGEVPSEAVAAAMLFAVSVPFLLLGLYYLFQFLS